MPVNISDFTILSHSNQSSILASIFLFVKKIFWFYCSFPVVMECPCISEMAESCCFIFLLFRYFLYRPVTSEDVYRLVFQKSCDDFTGSLLEPFSTSGWPDHELFFSLALSSTKVSQAG